MLRLYYNKRKAPEGIWSVDHGPGTEEKNYGCVTVSCVMHTNSDPNAVWPSPSAWLETEDEVSELVVYPGVLVLEYK